MGCKRQKLGASNGLSKTFESVQVKFRWVLEKMRGEIQIMQNLSIDSDTVAMGKICRVMIVILR